MSAKRLIVVLGMHRSGTSALTRSLKSLNVNLGGNLDGPRPDNPKGFWEDLECQYINEALLGYCKSSWDSYFPPGCLATADENINALQVRAIGYISARLRENGGIWGFKDPRTCRLLGFWQSVFSAVGCEVSYLIAIRNPLAVARSLERRDGMAAKKSYILWLEHVVSALRDTAGQQRLVVEYDNFMDDTYGQLDRISKAFDLAMPDRNSVLIQDFEENFLSRELRHHYCAEAELRADSKASPLVKRCYDLLHQLAFDVASFDEDHVKNELCAMVSAWEDHSPLLSLYTEVESALKFAESALCEQVAQTTQAQDQYNSMRAQYEDRCLKVASLEQAVEAYAAHASSLEVEVKAYADHARNLEIQRDSVAAQYEESSLKIAALEESLARQTVHTVQLQSQCDSMAAQYEDHCLKVSSLEQAVEAYAAHAGSLGVEVKAYAAHARSLEIQRAQLQEELTCANREMRKMRKSTAWRFRQKIINFKKKAIDPLKRPLRLRKRKEKQPNADHNSNVSLHPDPASLSIVQSAQGVSEYVGRFSGEQLSEKPVRIICFYLPQFHAIPENDAWWGEGFTEWSNVRPAVPQFAGHYQPHIPDELGYYDLLDGRTQQKQVELAKLYGIEGFCFYFYWFAGKRLLETPVLNYLADASLDLPFCLCWANENWSRRWDGLDSELLIAQEYSAEDDLAFIEYVSRYLRDQRYIRINGKPLLMVYRPNLLPDPVQTMERWRHWCREHGIGEIYLAYTQSFEAVDPMVYGMDAAIEFPPNNSSPPNITKDVVPAVSDFEGAVYDWRVFIERSKNYQEKDYTVFRSVCPSWDNTARRKNKGIAFANSSPFGFQQWLFNAIRYTCKHFEKCDERLVFVNAWNEWAEGAHLEPDRRYGFSWLEATRMALVRSSLIDARHGIDVNRPVAIVVHAFYEDIFNDIFHYLEKIQSIPVKLYVTCPVDLTQAIESKLKQLKHEYYLLAVNNKGRDVLPFLKVSREIQNNHHDVIIKVHTKKSLHRSDGDVWRNDLYEKLLTEPAIMEVLDLFAAQPEVGIWGPEGHVVPMSFYWGSNAHNVEKLAARLGVGMDIVNSLNFVAGTMFIARVSALEPVFHLALSEDDFEVESGQVDGTLAHAIERVFSVGAASVAMVLGGKDLGEKKSDYQFAERCATHVPS